MKITDSNGNTTGKLLSSILLVLMACILSLFVLLRAGVIGKGVPDAVEEQEQTAEPENTPEPEVIRGMEPVDVVISEVMSSNKVSFALPDGSFPDWLELHNAGSERISLLGYRIKCGGNTMDLPDVELDAGAYLAVICDGVMDADDGLLHSDFTVPREGAETAFLLADGTALSSFSFPEGKSDVSFINVDGEAVSCVFPTPGFENTHDGYAAFQNSLKCGSDLVIYEALVYNSEYLPQNREYYDYVELKNVSSGPVELGSYFLSDKTSDRALFQLPEKTLPAGESFYVFCTDDEEAVISNIGVQAPFGLSAERDRLYLSSADGTLCDYCSLHDIPLGGSMGRIDGENGFFYFEEATPQKPNENGFRSVTDAPVVIEGEEGVFNGVESVSIAIAGEGRVYYTTDGSMPTENSMPYVEPLSFSQTTVLRAVSIVPGALPGRTLDLSFIINENHTLPVVSLVMEPGDFKGSNGFYNNFGRDLEKECTARLFDDGEGFTIHCGVKLHGATSKKAQEKKSMKLCFRSRYDGELNYDLFENGVTDFTSILLRAAQEDYYSSMMRDSITHDLAAACFPDLPTQAHKYSVLYVNGVYWGIYNIREAHSPAHYANHYGYDVNTVTQAKESWTNGLDYADEYKFAVSNNLNDPENYNRVREHLNINSVIGWSIMEAYTGNMDCHSPNMRFYYSTEDNIMTYALVDLDLGYFESWRTFDVPFEFGYAYNTLADKLTESSSFREDLLSQLSAALTGPMSNENVLALIDEYEAELEPEVSRDREKWGGSIDYWQNKMLRDLRSFITDGSGRARTIANSISARFNLSAETKNRFFSEVK